MKTLILHFILFYLLLVPGSLFAQFIDTSAERVKTPLVVNL